MRSDIAAPLKGDSPATGRSGRPGRTRSLLVGAQACASIVLLILAALFTRTVVHVAGADVGSDVDRLLTVAPRFDAAGYDAARASSYWQQALQRVGDLPGVERASLATNPPFLGRGYRGLRPTYRGRVYDIHRNWVASDYFETAGIQILRGRTFTAAEVAANAPVVVISERVARWLWGDEEPIGDTLSRIAADMPGEEGQARVVGVAGDAVDRLEDPTIAATLYHPLAGESVARASLVVRGHGDAKDIVGPVFEAVRALDPEVLPVAQTVRDGIRDARMPLRLFAASAAALGAVALALAVIGIFGVTAFTVAQRTEEIGVRVAIGATARDVARLMLADNLRPVAIGLAVGFLAAIAGGRVLSAVLFGISPHDPGSILAAVLILLGAATAAALLPTRRATRIDPAIVLRRH